MPDAAYPRVLRPTFLGLEAIICGLVLKNRLGHRSLTVEARQLSTAAAAALDAASARALIVSILPQSLLGSSLSAPASLPCLADEDSKDSRSPSRTPSRLAVGSELLRLLDDERKSLTRKRQHPLSSESRDERLERELQAEPLEGALSFNTDPEVGPPADILARKRDAIFPSP
eukprot:684446-Hanusia_phi.AAC.1